MPDFSDPAVAQSYVEWALAMGVGALKVLFILALGWMVAKSAHRMTLAATSTSAWPPHAPISRSTPLRTMPLIRSQGRPLSAPHARAS